MKKILLTILGLGLIWSLTAQSAGFKVGGLMSTASFNDGAKTDLGDAQLKFGWHAGLVVDIGIIQDALSIQTGANIATKGYRTEFRNSTSVSEIELDTKRDIYYIDVPVMLKPSYRSGDVRIFGLAGGYFGYGISGKYRYEGSTTILGVTAATDGTEDIVWGTKKDENNLKRIDYGLRLGIGAEFNYSFYIDLYYDIGLADITPETSTKVSNTVIGLSVGALFGSGNYY